MTHLTSLLSTRCSRSSGALDAALFDDPLDPSLSPRNSEPLNARFPGTHTGFVSDVTTGRRASANPRPGSNNSALLRLLVVVFDDCPPASKTLPLGSKVAVWKLRGVISAPPTVKAPVAGSYSSEEPTVAVPVTPPASRT